MPRPSSFPETLFTCADCRNKSTLLKNGHAKKFIERGGMAVSSLRQQARIGQSLARSQTENKRELEKSQ